MGWSVYADDFTTAEMVGTTKTCRLVPDRTIEVVAVRTWIVVLNNPAFTSLHMRIYSDAAGVADTLLHTSTNVLTKEEIITEANGVKEIYFTFDRAVLAKDVTYHFVINGVGYTGTSESHVAWKKAWPDPVYGGFTPSVENLATAPYALYLVGGEF